jgi:hypothetical protein
VKEEEGQNIESYQEMEHEEHSITPTSYGFEGRCGEDCDAEKGYNSNDDNYIGETFVDNAGLKEIVHVPHSMIEE